MMRFVSSVGGRGRIEDDPCGRLFSSYRRRTRGSLRVIPRRTASGRRIRKQYRNSEVDDVVFCLCDEKKKIAKKNCGTKKVRSTVVLVRYTLFAAHAFVRGGQQVDRDTILSRSWLTFVFPSFFSTKT